MLIRSILEFLIVSFRAQLDHQFQALRHQQILGDFSFKHLPLLLPHPVCASTTTGGRFRLKTTPVTQEYIKELYSIFDNRDRRTTSTVTLD